MSSSFGEVLRAARVAQDATLGRVAEHVGFSTSYVSDVEHGRRAPFDDDVIDTLAVLLSADKKVLRQAAARTRGKVEISVTGEMSDDVLKMLMALKESVSGARAITSRGLRRVLRELAS